MQPGVRRAYILLGIIGVIEVVALLVLLLAPAPHKQERRGASTPVATSTQ